MSLIYGGSDEKPRLQTLRVRCADDWSDDGDCLWSGVWLVDALDELGEAECPECGGPVERDE